MSTTKRPQPFSRPAARQPKQAERPRPPAPPVYRPQPTPAVLQRKPALAPPPRQGQKPQGQAARTPAQLQAQRAAPPPKVLQRKTAAPPPPAKTAARTPAAPPAYRPQPVPKVLQLKKADGLRAPAQRPPAAARPGGVIQRVIKGYLPGTLARTTKVKKVLDDNQRQKVQDLHDDENNVYTMEQAWALVGYVPTGGTQNDNNLTHTPPFPFRYGNSGPNYMSTVVSDKTGFVQYPMSGLPQNSKTPQTQISIVSGSSYDDMPTSSHRNVTQSQVMDYVSPNAAAKTLGFNCPTSRSWEWLHLVAFSIRETHVNGLSAQSMKLMERTDQPQQIRENLVLGTAAANTAMLSYEAVIKKIMADNPSWKLDLWVCAHKTDHKVYNNSGKKVTIPVGTRIDYHFFFTTGDGKVIPPVCLAFDTRSHQKPPKSEYGEIYEALAKHILNAIQLKHELKSIQTSIFDEVKVEVMDDSDD